MYWWIVYLVFCLRSAAAAASVHYVAHKSDCDASAARCTLHAYAISYPNANGCACIAVGLLADANGGCHAQIAANEYPKIFYIILILQKVQLNTKIPKTYMFCYALLSAECIFVY